MNKIAEIKKRFDKALDAKSGWGKLEIKTMFNNIVINVLIDADKEDPFNIYPLTDAGEQWECDNSPTGNCVYNEQLDPAMDSCIFCGEPLERK